MALVPAQAPATTGFSSSLVPYGSAGDIGEPQERKLQRLRADREAHSRKQIWTKDAHGGPYQKVNPNKGYDPLIQLPDGSSRKTGLGYERVKTGPTSNFVGNHMTQGAIDLVQAQLEAPASASRPQLLLGAAAAAAERHRPLLLHMGDAAQVAAAQARPLQAYSWSDEGAAVTVQVPVGQVGLAAGAAAEVACTIRPDCLQLSITVPAAASSAPAQPESTFAPSGANGSPGSHRSSSSSSHGHAGAAQAVEHVLRLAPLHGAVLPSRSRCFVTGPPALLPGSSANDASSSGSSGGPGDHAGSGAGAEDEEAPSSREAQELANQEEPLLTVRFCLPPGAQCLVVQLAKADPQREWEALQAAPALPLACGARAGGPQPDLSALRKAVRQQLGRAPAAPAVPTSSDCGPATPAQGPDMADAAAAAAPATSATDLSSSDMQAACQAALQEAEVLVAAGQHSGAVDRTAACTAWLADPACAVPASLAARVWVLRARCHTQLGFLKQAAADFTAAIQLLQGAPAGQWGGATRQLAPLQQQQQAELQQLLLARSAVFEQQEQLEAALADAEQAARVRQPAPAAALLAAQRLRQACQQRRSRQ